MPHLTSAQEAAFNAAGEAIADLCGEGVRITIGALGSGKMHAFCDDPNQGKTIFSDNAPTMAGAVQSLLCKYAAKRDAPPKIETAAAAIAAAKTAISDLANENNSKFIDSDLLAERLEAIAVA